jgi:uncharacterized membrane protein
MTDTPPLPSSTRGLKIALAVSVALNLAVAGLVIGAFLGGGPGHMPRDLSFGPFSAALSKDDRKALRDALFARGGDFQATRKAARAEFETLVATLRAEPFDPAAFTTALAAIETRNAERLELGRSLLEARIVGMSGPDRLAFADRLETGMRKMRREGKPGE